MVRRLEDRLGKMLFREVLQPHGPVQVGQELLPDSLAADVLAQAPPDLPDALPGAGMLCPLIRGRLAVIEPFSDSISPLELRSAAAKLDMALYLALRQRQPEEPYPRGCLLVLSPRESALAVREVLDGPARELDLGLWAWGQLDPVFFVRTDLVPERPDTLLFRLLARGPRRTQAIAEVFDARLEPYESVLLDFSGRIEEMASMKQPVWVGSPEFEEMREVAQTVRQVLTDQGRQVGLQEGRQEGRQEGLRQAVLRLVGHRWPALRDQADQILPQHPPEADLEALIETLIESASAEDALRALQALAASAP